MRALVYQKSSRSFTMTTLPDPVPANGQVLIKVEAVSLNAADYRSMQIGAIPKQGIFGADVTGIVEKTGPDCTRFNPGDAVMADLADSGFGGLAERVVVRESLLVSRPASVSVEDAACLPLAGVTALQALRDHTQLEPGQSVLIVGASGGVGTMAIQIARHFGAVVTAVCSSRHVSTVSHFGASEVIDYSQSDWTQHKQHYDVILAINGNHPLRSYYRHLKPGGTCVVVGGSYSQIISSLLFGWLWSFGSRAIKAQRAKPNAEDLEYIATLASNGHLKPVIDTILPFEKTADGFERIRHGHAAGKVVIRM